MRILIVSDSHQRSDLLSAIIAREPEAAMIIHLGDGKREALEIKNNANIPVLLAKGNCDICCEELQEELDLQICGKHIFASHGDRFNVKFGLEKLQLYARLSNSDIVLFGHTHVPYLNYEDGVYFFNPGAVRDRCYGCLDLTDSGAFFIHKMLK